MSRSWYFVFLLLYQTLRYILQYTNCIVPTVCPPDERRLECTWTVWFNLHIVPKTLEAPSDEFELLEDARHIPGFPGNCQEPSGIECRTVDTHQFSNETADAATCDLKTGLRCLNGPNRALCLDYEVRYRCCQFICPTTVPPETTPFGKTTTTGLILCKRSL